jgi:hypothetical protein
MTPDRESDRIMVFSNHRTLLINRVMRAHAHQDRAVLKNGAGKFKPSRGRLFLNMYPSLGKVKVELEGTVDLPSIREINR